MTQLKNLVSHVKQLKTGVDSVGQSTGITKLNNQLKNSNGISSFSKNVKGLLGIGTFVTLGRRVATTMSEMTKESVDFVETTNLFNVSMGKGLDILNQHYEKAVHFQNELSEKLGVNIAESMQYQALFNNMSKSMGITAKYAYTLSENLTKMGYDLASLYNIDTTESMRKLRAGLAGETEPLRAIGLDITEQSLQPILDSLGINESLRNMTQAEKIVLRYIAILKQAQSAQGDFANTIESPANQLRIFNAQVIAFKRNMGNLWQGFLGGILPYINAVMMVVNELLKMVAKLFGFKVSEQPVNISANIGADDLAGDLDTAGKKAKELKTQLMGFDEINNITLETKNESGSASGASVGGIDQRLLNAMTEYDNLMDKVRSKATDVRDKIMEWLGFTKKINPLTGEVSWELGEGNTNLKKILGWAKALLGLYITTKVMKLVGWLNNLWRVFKGMKTPVTSFQNGLSLVGKGLTNTGTVLKLGVEQFKAYRKAGDSVTTSLGKTGKAMCSLIPNAVKVAGGLAGLVGSSVLAYKSMEDLSNGVIGTEEAVGKLAISIGGATASGALLGSSFGTTGAIIGGTVGLIVSAGSAIVGYNTKLRENGQNIEELKNKHEQLINTYKNNIDQINKNKEAQKQNLQVLSEEVSSLDIMIDKNGKVKESYKERVEYILNDVNQALGTEYKLTGNQITQNGRLVTSYDELKSSVDQYIEKKQKEIEIEAYQEIYKEELKKKAELLKQLNEAQKNTNEAEKEYNRLIKEGSDANTIALMTLNGYQTAWAKSNYDTAVEEEKKIQSELNNTKQSIIDSKETWETELKNISSSVDENSNKITTITRDTLLKQTKSVEDLTPENIEAWKKLAEGSKKEYYDKLSQIDDDTAFILEILNNNIDISSPSMISKFKKMGEESEEKLNGALSSLPEDMQLLIETLTKTTENLSPEQIQKWADLAKNNKSAYEKNLNGMDNITKQRIQSCVNAINDKKWTAEETAKGLANAVEKGVNTIDTTEAGRQAVSGVAEGINKNKNSWNLWSSLRGLASVVTNGVKSLLGIHSPSKVMADIAQYIPLGIAKGIDDNSNTVFGSMEKLSKGIEMNTKDLSLNTSQYIDYGAISGNIATQTNVNMNNNMINQIGQACYNAFVNAMRNEGIKVDIHAETEEGVIVKKATKGIIEYVEQTGELPFPVPL